MDTPDLAIAIASSTPDNGITAPFHLNALPTFPPFDPSQINPGLYASCSRGSRREWASRRWIPTTHALWRAVQHQHRHQMKNQLFFELGLYFQQWTPSFSGGNPLNQVPVSEASASITQADRPFPSFRASRLSKKTITPTTRGLY